MGLRSKRTYNRLNRARMDSSALAAYRGVILRVYKKVEAAHRSWMAGGSPSALAIASQDFIDSLSEVFLVSNTVLSLGDRPRPHSRDSKGRVRGELFGSCQSDGKIRIYLRTPARGQPTAFKTFFNTLVHEWVHHYDFEALKDSVHCSGFYDRVNAIYRTCIQAVEGGNL